MRLGPFEIRRVAPGCTRMHSSWLNAYKESKRLNPDAHPPKGQDFLICSFCRTRLYDERPTPRF